MMLALWIRIAQVRGSCRCPQCISAAHAVARSNTTSAARRPQYWTSSTLWYSGIFAAAATWDAMFKVQRREKWDKAIAEIKQELEDYDGFEADLILQAQARKEEQKSRVKYGYTLHGLAGKEDGGSRMGVETGRRERRTGSIAIIQENSALQDLAANAEKALQRSDTQDIGVAILARDEAEEVPGHGSGIRVFEGDEALQELAANLDSTSKRERRPKWPANTGHDTNPKYLPPQSIYAPDWLKRSWESRGWGKYKMERCMLSTDLFLLRTWNELRRRGMGEEAAKAVPSAYAKHLLMSEHELSRHIAQKEADLDILERLGGRRYELGHFERNPADLPFCGYHVDEYGEFHDQTRALNQSLRNLVQQAETDASSIPAFMAKVCYNLSSSTAPPNIDTYNTLLVALLNLRQVKHTEHVIHSLLRTRARPNEVTLATVLNFHTATGDVGNFKWWVQRMRGEFGGLMNASPHTPISSKTGNRLVHYDNGKNDGLGTIVQLPYPTPMVFGALIKGVLHFSGFEAALKICESMAHEGWSLCISGLGVMLKDCTERRDWTSGLTVWKQIQALKWKSARYSSSTWTSERIGLQTFISMLQLCCRCGQRSVFEDVMDQAVRAHPQALTDIIEFVRSDKPVVSTLDMSGVEDLMDLDAIAPAKKAPLGDPVLALKSLSDDFPLEGAATADDIAIESLKTGPDELRDCQEEASYQPFPADLEET